MSLFSFARFEILFFTRVICGGEVKARQFRLRAETGKRDRGSFSEKIERVNGSRVGPTVIFFLDQV